MVDSSQFITGKDKIGFREIVLGHLKKILEISCSEFRGGYWKEINHGNYFTKEYVPDQRACYIQAVGSFSDVLLPHFDKQMQKDYVEIQKKIKNIKQTLEAERNKELKEEWEFECKKAKVKGTNPPEEIELEEQMRKPLEGGEATIQRFTQRKLDLHKELFQKLNLLLRRVDYLKGTIYGEEEDLLEIDEEEK